MIAISECLHYSTLSWLTYIYQNPPPRQFRIRWKDRLILSFRLLFKIEVKVVQKCAVVYFRTMHWGTFKEQRKGGEIVVRVTTHISADN